MLYRFSKYFVCGGISTFIDLFLFWLLHLQLGMYYNLAAIIAFCCALAFNYLVSRYWVFGPGSRSMKTEAMLVTLVSVVGLGINLVILTLLIETFHIHAMLAKIAGTGVTLFWNFAARHYWIFK